MTVNKILGMGLTDDRTEIFIRDEDSKVIAYGNWYQDDILEYTGHVAESFTWQDDITSSTLT